MSTDPQGSVTEVEQVARKLFAYCKANNWSGYDPYDALNSGLFAAVPALDSRLPRLVITQTLKRSPINVRALLQIPKTQNPKGIALFLSALLRAPRLAATEGAASGDLVGSLAQTLSDLRSPGTPYWCWGYSFPWQTRTIVVPRGTPNLVCTVFVAEALLDLYEKRGDARHLEMAFSAAEYILKDLYWSDGGAVAGFSYPLPSERTQIHNANLLGAAFLCRVSALTGDAKFVEPAMKAARHSAARQAIDGSWAYGEAETQTWIDNFHTGYNLDALRQIDRCLGTREFEARIRLGFDFYRAHFLREDGAARYFHDRTYPIDIHCVAQSILTLLAFRDFGPDNVRLAHRVFQWAVNNMWDERGYFHYRVLRFATIRTPYMRWSQAWMLLAVATLLEESTTSGEPRVNPASAVWA